MQQPEIILDPGSLPLTCSYSADAGRRASVSGGGLAAVGALLIALFEIVRHLFEALRGEAWYLAAIMVVLASAGAAGEWFKHRDLLARRRRQETITLFQDRMTFEAAQAYVSLPWDRVADYYAEHHRRGLSPMAYVVKSSLGDSIEFTDSISDAASLRALIPMLSGYRAGSGWRIGASPARADARPGVV